MIVSPKGNVVDYGHQYNYRLLILGYTVQFVSSKFQGIPDSKSCGQRKRVTACAVGLSVRRVIVSRSSVFLRPIAAMLP